MGLYIRVILGVGGFRVTPMYWDDGKEHRNDYIVWYQHQQGSCRYKKQGSDTSVHVYEVRVCVSYVYIIYIYIHVCVRIHRYMPKWIHA